MKSVEFARRRMQAIVDAYPKTAAAEQAKKLLEESNQFLDGLK
jgi:hypothetical protein